MLADDPRHGTYAGFSAHKRAGQKACEPCRIARNERRAGERERRRNHHGCVDCGKSTVSKDRICQQCRRRHISHGYSPADALDGGRWVPSGGIMRWEPAA